MRRKIDDVLTEWAHSGSFSPLLLRGARRVGKTYSIKRLGDEEFGRDRFAYCDFQTNLEQLSSVFDGPMSVEGIVARLSLVLDKDIRPKETLIALDEVQLCEKALNSLRFFADSDYRVIASGSQLGISLQDRELPFPSDVRHINLRPLDFEEFLWALGENRLADGIREHVQSFEKFILHDKAMGLYRTYQVVGGMPRAVLAYVDADNFAEVRAVQSELDRTYTADIALYAAPDMAVHAQAIWSSVPAQLARETTRKFKYADVKKGGRERMLRTPLGWLEAAEIVLLNYQTNDMSAPLLPRMDGSFFKVYMSDTGLLFYRYNLSARAYLSNDTRASLSPRFRGALAENYVMQSLVANGLATFYWSQGGSSKGELEFVLQNGMGQVVPIEVKSGGNVRSRSLDAFMEKSGAPKAIRLSSKNFGSEGAILSMPLYSAFCIDRAFIDAI